MASPEVPIRCSGVGPWWTMAGRELSFPPEVKLGARSSLLTRKKPSEARESRAMPKTLPGMLVMIGCQGAELACFLTDGVASCSRHFGCDSVLPGDLDHLNKSRGGHGGEDGGSAMLCSMAGSSTAQHGHLVCRLSPTESRGFGAAFWQPFASWTTSNIKIRWRSFRRPEFGARVLLNLTSRMTRQATDGPQGSFGSRIAERRE